MPPAVLRRERKAWSAHLSWHKGQALVPGRASWLCLSEEGHICQRTAHPGQSLGSQHASIFGTRAAATVRSEMHVEPGRNKGLPRQRAGLCCVRHFFFFPFTARGLLIRRRRRRRWEFRRWDFADGSIFGLKITLSGRGRTLTTRCGCHRRLQIVGSRWDFVDGIS